MQWLHVHQAKESAAAQAEAAARAELAEARVQSLLSHAAELEAQHAAALAETRSETEAVERRLQGELASATASVEAAHVQLQHQLWLTEQERMQAQAALQAAAHELAQGQALQEEAAHELGQARASLAQGEADMEELRAQRACPELPQACVAITHFMHTFVSAGGCCMSGRARAEHSPWHALQGRFAGPDACVVQQGVLSENGERLGKGGYGTVDKHTVTVAVKKVQLLFPCAAASMGCMRPVHPEARHRSLHQAPIRRPVWVNVPHGAGCLGRRRTTPTLRPACAERRGAC